jgi:hypothetical protein
MKSAVGFSQFIRECSAMQLSSPNAAESQSTLTAPRVLAAALILIARLL